MSALSVDLPSDARVPAARVPDAQRSESAVPATGIRLDIDPDARDRQVAPGCSASVPRGRVESALRAPARALDRHPGMVGADVAEGDATADALDARTVRPAALYVLELSAGLADKR